MKPAILLLPIVLFLSSCEKDEEITWEYTSDVPDDFSTAISVEYNQNNDLTTVKTFFSAEYVQECCEPKIVIGRTLKLPSESYIKYNGIIYTGYPVLEMTAPGNEDAMVEFLNFDQVWYVNTIGVPDTAFLENLPDTIDAGQDFLLGLGGPALENDEHWEIYLSANNDYGDFVETTTDSSILIDNSYLRPGSGQKLQVRRIKRLADPHLPVGGGAITFIYTIEKTIYSE